MKKYIICALFLWMLVPIAGQNVPLGKLKGGSIQNTDNQGKKETIKPEIKTWRLIDDFTHADTIAIDTLTTSVQIYNPIWRNSIGNVTTGNLGAPSQSTIFDNRRMRNDFIFYNPLITWFDYPQDITYYNTRTPYVNLSFHSGQPKRRSEEFVRALYTQNINKNWNVGMIYSLVSAIGRYDAQKVKNADFKLFSSYDGEKYRANGGIIYTRATQSENGGLLDDNDILKPKGDTDYDQPENLPINFRDAEAYLRSFQIYYHQAYHLGTLTRTDKEGEEQQLPVSTLLHSLHLDLAKRSYTIGDLPDYTNPLADKFYPDIYIDSLRTYDKNEYTLISNQFQIKFNEEANSLLRFGMRAFISNDIRLYDSPMEPLRDSLNRLHYRYDDTKQVSSHVGGQIFKNIGENFRWNAGLKFYFQGYRIGDVELTGKMETNFKLLNQPTQLFADGGFFLRTPEFQEEHFFSNHIQWNRNFIREKIIKLRGGLRLENRKLWLTGSVKSINGYIFYNKSGVADQNNDLIQVLSVEAGKHFRLMRLNSVNQVAWQFSSNNNALPLPELSLYSSNYYENMLFKVLTFQLGFDVRYHTRYYAPYYLPATGQFISQDARTVGDYPFVDLFLNFQLKRARIYVKYDHANKGWPNNDYFFMPGYPANPRSLKFGVSWNFYD